MKSKDDMSGCKPLPGGKEVGKTDWVGYTPNTGIPNIGNCCPTDKKSK